MNALVRLVLPDVQDLLREGTPEDVATALAPFHSADVGELLGELPDEEAGKLLVGLPVERRVEVFEQLEVQDQVRLVYALGAETLAPIVAAMASDDRADLVSELPPEHVSSLLTLLPPEEAKDVALLANYEEESAGGIMTSEFVRLSPTDTAAQAIERVRAQATRRETVHALYVLDDDGRLVGVVSVTNLILSPPDDPISAVMYDNPITVSVDTDQETVVTQLRHYDFLAIPVLDRQGRMVGIVTHDDVLDVAMEEADEDAQRMAGVEPLEGPYFSTALMTLVRKRAVWLTVLFATGLVAGSILRGFEEALQKTVALVYFLPLIIAAGGNTGSQSATLVVRGIAMGEMRFRDTWRILKRELISGVLLGVLLGALGLGVALVWGKQDVALVVLLTLIAVVTVGSLLGCTLPLLLDRIGIDPAITSSPLVAALVDVLGILIYVLLAMVLIGA